MPAVLQGSDGLSLLSGTDDSVVLVLVVELVVEEDGEAVVVVVVVLEVALLEVLGRER